MQKFPVFILFAAMIEWNKRILKAFVFCFLFMMMAVLPQSAFAQTNRYTDSLKQAVFGGRLHYGFIFVHSYHVENVRGGRPRGFELEYSKQFTDSNTFKKYHCYPRTGWSFTYTDYDKSFLGSSWSASYFVEPQFRLSNKANFLVRGTLGLSYLTNPFDSIKNPENASYSLPVNFNLQLGVGISYHISRHTSLYGMGNFFHNSNGDLAQPNRGVNYINASLGVLYHTYSSNLPHYKKIKDTSWRTKPIHIDASFFFTPKSGYNAVRKPTRYFVAGVGAAAGKEVSSSNAITLAGEIYYDDALRSIKDLIHDDSPSTLGGILIGHQFLINKFSFGQQMGVYVYKHLKTYNELWGDRWHTLYQRYTIDYNIKNHWYLGVSLLTHAQVADFFDGRVIYRFNK